MSTATIPRLADLVKARGGAPGSNLPGRWIHAGTLVSDPYPCVCRYSPCRWEKCDDRELPPVAEGWALPPGCCGRRAAKPAQSAVERSEGSGGTGMWEEGVSSLQGRPRHHAAALACDCQTPWDAPPPLLLIAAGKDGPVVATYQLADRGPDGELLMGAPVGNPRAAADAALAADGLRRAKPWADGRHVLLPPSPGARGKTRPCWHAQLADGSLAVLDTPDETGSGVHCPDCHQNFANAGAWDVHRTKGRHGLGECKDPGSVLAVVDVEVIPARADLVGRVFASSVGRVAHGSPMLRRGVGGVWAVDPGVVWGARGCPMSREEISSAWVRAQERLAGRRWKFGRGHNRGGSPVL